MRQALRTRVLLLASLTLPVLAGCSSATDGALSGQPSLATARVALAGGSAGLAYNICENQLKERPREAELLACKGDALVELGRPAEAVSAYDAALRERPDSEAARIGLGRLRLGTDPAAAEALFLAVLAKNSRNAVALNNLGIARDLQGRHADAQTAYGEAIGADPSMRAAQVNLALSLALGGRAGEGARILRPIAERPEATARERHDYAAILAMDGRSDDAARLLRAELSGTQADAAVDAYRSLSPSRVAR